MPAASCTTSDSLSGKKTDAQLTVTGGPTGYVTASCKGGTDNAGNTRSTPGDDVTATYQVVYRWDGFLQPINDTAHQIGLLESKFKLGSTVPVKLQLKRSDGTIVQGTAPTFAQKRIGTNCDTTTDSETAVASDATTGSAFRWDTTLNGYIYNFSTGVSGR